MQTLFQLKEQKTTIILITHRLNLVSVADKVLLMKGGMVEAFGPRDEVMSKLTLAVAPGPTNVAMMTKAPVGNPRPIALRPQVVNFAGAELIANQSQSGNAS